MGRRVEREGWRERTVFLEAQVRGVCSGSRRETAPGTLERQQVRVWSPTHMGVEVSDKPGRAGGNRVMEGSECWAGKSDFAD